MRLKFPKKITAGVETGRLSLLLTFKLNYKPFIKHQWIHEAQVIWIWLADAVMKMGDKIFSVDTIVVSNHERG